MMKIKFPVIALLVNTALLSTMAHAADGTINFTGNITAAACTVDTASANRTVALGNVSSSAFTAAGSTASPTAFVIDLTNCPATVTSASTKFDGPANATNSSIIALSSGQTATGVGVAIYENDSSTLIPLGTASKAKAITTAGPNTLNFIAKYMATAAAVTAGTANAVTTFTVVYN
ncbi:fimbrial protein [Ewingella americana]|uniref:fimbrial protein n=1 Tax=Ewingella americana TaxID=41202 RepID=UPI0030B86EBE